VEAIYENLKFRILIISFQNMTYPVDFTHIYLIHEILHESIANHLVTVWKAAAILSTLPVLRPAIEILPSLVI